MSQSSETPSPDNRPLQRLAITGSSGYLGSQLIEAFRKRASALRILGLDLREPGSAGPDEFVRGDILRPDLGEILRAFVPDTIIHAAFAFQPSHDERRMRQVNVEGARNVLQAAAVIRPARLLVVSSATAYGAWPDNPLPMDESWPLRARTTFRYAADKTEVEQEVAQFAAEQPGIAVSVVRPTLIGGPHMDNYVRQFVFGMPFVARLDGHDTPLQFVHEEDVTAAIYEIVTRNGRGAYNVAPPDSLRLSELARQTGRPCWRLPFWLAYAAHWLAWASRLPCHHSPAPFLYFVRYPWVVAPARLERELGFRFRFSSRETVQQTFEGWQQRRTTHAKRPSPSADQAEP